MSFSQADGGEKQSEIGGQRTVINGWKMAIRCRTENVN